MMHRALHALLVLLVAGASIPARADVTPIFHLEGGADLMLTDTYRDRFDWGGHGAVRAGLELIGPLAVQVGFATAWFPVDGQEPGNLYAIELGARGFFRIDDALGGPFVDLNGGAGITGDLVRFMFDVGLGWDFFPHPMLGVGPVVRYMQIVQPDGEPVGADAYLFTFGVSLTVRIDLGDEPAAEPEERPHDADGDGVPDSRDRCPGEPEDVDGFADDDGCPDGDNDSDGIDDVDDRCPDAAETRNGFEDDDGCPDQAPPPPPVVSEPEPEMLPQTVHFRLGSWRVSARYRTPLREVCELLSAQPTVRVRVIGHADEQGTPAANHRLGANRAGSIAEQLVLCGVSPERIESTSYGDTRRRCDDSTEECRTINRRVEFEILR